MNCRWAGNFAKGYEKFPYLSPPLSISQDIPENEISSRQSALFASVSPFRGGTRENLTCYSFQDCQRRMLETGTSDALSVLLAISHSQGRNRRHYLVCILQSIHLYTWKVALREKTITIRQ